MTGSTGSVLPSVGSAPDRSGPGARPNPPFISAPAASAAQSSGQANAWLAAQLAQLLAGISGELKPWSRHCNLQRESVTLNDGSLVQCRSNLRKREGSHRQWINAMLSQCLIEGLHRSGHVKANQTMSETLMSVPI